MIFRGLAARSIFLQLNDFSRFINKNIRPLAEFEDGRRALIMANAAKKSLSSKKFEKLTF